MRIIMVAGILSLSGLAGYAAKKQPVLPAYNDPPGQLFRMAPMTKSSRSLVINLSNNLHLAYDTQNMRIHTAWKGKGLDLYGPCYHGGKRPFICHKNGTALWGNPPIQSWMQEPNAALKTQYKGFSSLNGQVTLLYQLAGHKSTTEVRETFSSQNGTFIRTFQFDSVEGNITHKAHIEEGIPIKIDFPRTVAIQRKDDVLVCILKGQGAIKVIKDKIVFSEEQFTEEGSTKGNQFTRHEAQMAQIIVSIKENNSPSKFELISFTAKDPIAAAKAAQGFSMPKFKITNSKAVLLPANPKARRSFVFDPHYKVEALALPDINLFATGMDWVSPKDLAICTYTGEVWIVENATGPIQKMKYRRFARGMNEPMGLLVRDGHIYLGNKSEVTRLQDTNDDGVADLFERVSSDWDYTGSYNSFSYGPVLDRDGNLIIANAGHAGHWDAKHMGWALKISPESEKATPFASGLREPNGIIAFGQEKDLFVTDNQGAWIGACKLNHVKDGGFYGHPTSKPAPKEEYIGRESMDPPAVWFPYKWVRSASGMTEIIDDRFGPFKGQLLVSDFQNAVITRVQLEKVEGQWQGAVWPFLKGFQSGVNRIIMGKDGNLYAGGGKVRAWAANAPAFHSLERVTFTGKTPFEVQSVNVLPEGFRINFTAPVNKDTAKALDGFDVWQYNYKLHKKYGSPEFNHEGKADSFTVIKVDALTVSTDRLSITIGLNGWKAGYVTGVRALDVRSQSGSKLWHDTFYYTLNRIPEK